MKIILKLIIFQVFWNYGQVGIETITPASSAILDFPTTNNKRGIILPIVESLPTIGTASASRGTILLDKNDGKIKALIYKETTSGSGVFQDTWDNLTKNNGNVSSAVNNSGSEVGSGVIIGATSSSAVGVLVLESTNKALVLPKIANAHLTVVNPYPGMMCYDTTNKVVSIFNGEKWYFLR